MVKGSTLCKSLLVVTCAKDAAERGMCATVQMYFENAYCINCWYKDLDQPFIKYPPFVIHYAGCQMCTGATRCH